MNREIKKLLLTETEAAEYLEMSVSMLQKSRVKGGTQIANGLAPAFVKHIGGIRYCVEELQRFKAKQDSKDFYSQLQDTAVLEQDKVQSIEDVIELNSEPFEWLSIVEPSSIKSLAF